MQVSWTRKISKKSKSDQLIANDFRLIKLKTSHTIGFLKSF